MGLFFLLFGPFAKTLIPRHCEPERPSQRRGLGTLIATQLTLLFISAVLFSLLETQTQLNPRLQWFETGRIFESLKTKSVLLGILPWCMYSILGVGLAYFSVCCKRKAMLFKIIVPHPKGKFSWFMHNMLQTVNHIGVTFPFAFLPALTLICLYEGIRVFFNLESLFSSFFLPYFLISLRICLNPIYKKISPLIDKRKIPVGLVLIFCDLILLSCIILFQNIPIPIKVPNVKSVFAGLFTPERLQLRLDLLILGWWAIWIPWVASLIARTSIGYSVRRAVLQTLIVPVLIFGGVYFKITTEDWILFSKLLQMPYCLLAIGLGFLMLMWLMWGHMRTGRHIAVGCMHPLGRWYPPSAKKWLSGMVVFLFALVSVWLLMGWLPLQIIGTFALGYMIFLTTCFLIMMLRHIHEGHNRVKTKGTLEWDT